MVAPSITSVIQRRLVTSTSNAMSFLIKTYSRRTQPRTKVAPCATSIRTSRPFISTKARVGGSCKILHRKILPRVTTQRWKPCDVHSRPSCKYVQYPGQWNTPKHCSPSEVSPAPSAGRQPGRPRIPPRTPEKPRHHGKYYFVIEFLQFCFD